MLDKWIQMSCADIIFYLIFQVICFVDANVLFTMNVIALSTTLSGHQNKMYQFELEIVSELHKY